MKERATEKEIAILLVEDNPVDVQITQRAFERGAIKYKLCVVRDGEEALDFLFRKGQYAEESTAPRPDLILLDINLPRINGLEVLKRLKGDPNLKRIPVTMLTVSDKDEDVIRSFDSGVNSYITKPVDFNKFVEAMKAHHFYWTAVSELPPK